MAVDPPAIGERVVVTLHRAGEPGPEPYDAPGTVDQLVGSVDPPHRPLLAVVVFDDRDLGAAYVGFGALRREGAP